jgi:TctA family transporter
MFEEIIRYVWPIIVLQVTLQVIALINLSKREKVKFDNKKIWILIILLGGLLGSVGYFVFRGEDDVYGSED